LISKDIIKEVLGINADNTLINQVYKRLNKIKSKQKKFTFIDLFAGVGGIRTAFEPLGGECVFSSEWDRSCQETYFSNFGELPKGDINQIEMNEIPPHNLLLAGFPCQAFSIAGYRKGFEDARGTLFFNIADILEHHKPDGFLLENVKGLFNHTNFDGRKTYDRIKEILINLGYEVVESILNSLTHANIPQTRERIIIIGIKNELYNDLKLLNGIFKFPKAIKLTRTIDDLIDNNKKEEKYYYQIDHKYYDELQKNVKLKDTIYQWRRHYVRENKSNACPTLTANMGTGGHNVPIIKDNYGIRKLTPRECARFQGFKDSFILPNHLPDSKLYYQIGNSVTVPLIKRVARQLINYIKY
jgi:DNA (cytosine-5)-methyltransferase 1